MLDTLWPNMLITFMKQRIILLATEFEMELKQVPQLESNSCSADLVIKNESSLMNNPS